MSYSFYRITREEPIVWIQLNRASKKNAMGPDAWRELPLIMAEIDADESLRAAVITGDGRDFCAGIDLFGMGGEIPGLKDWDSSSASRDKINHYILKMQDAITAVERCRKPVICALHGYCIGAGLDLASACDIRLASADASISLREAAVAFICDLGSLQRVPLIVGQGVARELAFTAKYIDASRALSINLINAIFDDKEALLEGARQMALEIAANAPLAVQGSKQVLNYGRAKSVEAGLEYVAARSALTLPSEDLGETMAAFSERRQPLFKGR